MSLSFFKWGQGGLRGALDRRFSDSLHAITIKFLNP